MKLCYFPQNGITYRDYVSTLSHKPFEEGLPILENSVCLMDFSTDFELYVFERIPGLKLNFPNPNQLEVKQEIVLELTLFAFAYLVF